MPLSSKLQNEKIFLNTAVKTSIKYEATKQMNTLFMQEYTNISIPLRTVTQEEKNKDKC